MTNNWIIPQSAEEDEILLKQFDKIKKKKSINKDKETNLKKSNEKKALKKKKQGEK